MASTPIPTPLLLLILQLREPGLPGCSYIFPRLSSPLGCNSSAKLSQPGGWRVEGGGQPSPPHSTPPIHPDPQTELPSLLLPDCPLLQSPCSSRTHPPVSSLPSLHSPRATPSPPAGLLFAPRFLSTAFSSPSLPWTSLSPSVPPPPQPKQDRGLGLPALCMLQHSDAPIETASYWGALIPPLRCCVCLLADPSAPLLQPPQEQTLI